MIKEIRKPTLSEVNDAIEERGVKKSDILGIKHISPSRVIEEGYLVLYWDTKKVIKKK